MQMRLQEKDVHERANPYFERGRGMQKKYTLHMYAKRNGVAALGLSRQRCGYKREIERVATEAVEADGRR